MNKIQIILSNYRKEHRGENLTDVQIHEILFGKNSCFTIHHDYHGLYEDDYDEFIYFSNETGEKFSDKWGTMYACPPYDLFKTEFTFDEGVKNGLVDIKKYNEVCWRWANEDFKFGDTVDISFFNQYYNISPLVEVYRGRKNKGGVGYIVGKYTDNRYSYYGTTFAIFYDINKEQFFLINNSYFRVDKGWLNKAEEAINMAIKSERLVTDRIHNVDVKEIVLNSMFNGDYNKFIEPIKKAGADWFDKEQEKKYEPSEQFMQWLRDHFEGKTDEELREIGIRINKRR